MSTLFSAFVAAVVLGVAYVIHRFLSPTYGSRGLVALLAWGAYMGALGYGGGVANAKLVPPGLFYMMVPTVMLAVFTATTAAGKLIATRIPVALLLAAQSFRLVVELFLHGLWREGLLPTTMTYHGANYDIAIGASAPVVAWLFARGLLPPRLALLWNAVGIAMLANVAVRGVLSAPGVLHLLQTEVPNLAVGTFPYSYIPGLMVPLALVLHILAIRALRDRMRHGISGSHTADAALTQPQPSKGAK